MTDSAHTTSNKPDPIAQLMRQETQDMSVDEFIEKHQQMFQVLYLFRQLSDDNKEMVLSELRRIEKQ